MSSRYCNGVPSSTIKGETGIIGREGLVVRSCGSSTAGGVSSFFRRDQKEVLRERVGVGVSLGSLAFPLFDCGMLAPIEIPLVRDVVSRGLGMGEAGLSDEKAPLNF